VKKCSIGIALTIHILLILVILGIIPIIFWNKSPPFSPVTVEPRSIWCSYFWIICSYIRPGLGTGCPWIPIPSQVSHFYFLSKPSYIQFILQNIFFIAAYHKVKQICSLSDVQYCSFSIISFLNSFFITYFISLESCCLYFL